MLANFETRVKSVKYKPFAYTTEPSIVPPSIFLPLIFVPVIFSASTLPAFMFNAFMYGAVTVFFVIVTMSDSVGISFDRAISGIVPSSIFFHVIIAF